jgi:hypothetical protein
MWYFQIKKFNLVVPDGFSYYFHALRHNNPPKMIRNFGGGTVMVWAAFSMRSKTRICWISTKIDSRNYNDLLNCALIPFLDDEMNEDAIFQQDNASIHKSGHSLAWFEEKNSPLLD